MEDTLGEDVEIARRRDNLVIFSNCTTTAFSTMARSIRPWQTGPTDVLSVAFNGLSKNLSYVRLSFGLDDARGAKERAKSYIEGLEMLASRCTCANVLLAVCRLRWAEDADVDDLILPGGRLKEQRDLAYELITAIPGVSCVPSRGRQCTCSQN